MDGPQWRERHVYSHVAFFHPRSNYKYRYPFHSIHQSALKNFQQSSVFILQFVVCDLSALSIISMAERVPSAETVPEHQDRGLFGLFGKKEEETKHGDHIKPPASTHTQTQTPNAHLYPTNPPHGAVVNQPHAQGYGHGHAGQVTAAEAEKQQHTGLLGKLHRTNSSSSSSSSDEEGGKKKEGGRKKKGLKDKVKEKLPGGHQASSDAQGHGYEGEKRHEGEKKGLVDKIKDKLPGHHDKE